LDHTLTLWVYGSIHCNVQVSPISLSTVFVADFLGSAGLVSLCAAALDQFIFKFILALTIFCAIGFFLTTILSMAESWAYRHHKASNWFRDILFAYWIRTKRLLPVRIANKVGGGTLYLVTLIWYTITDIVVRLKRFLRHRRRRRALIPMAINSWRTLGAWAIGDIKIGGPDHLEIEVVHDEERRAVDLRAEVKIQEEKEKNATNFWHQAHNAEEVHLNMAITHAHLGVIR